MLSVRKEWLIMTIKNYGKVYQLAEDCFEIEYTLSTLTPYGFREVEKGLDVFSLDTIKSFNNKMPECRKIKLDTIYVQDKYNDSKLWIIERSKCGHYYLSEYIGKYKQGKARLGKVHIYDMLFH